MDAWASAIVCDKSLSVSFDAYSVVRLVMMVGLLFCSCQVINYLMLFLPYFCNGKPLNSKISTNSSNASAPIINLTLGNDMLGILHPPQAANIPAPTLPLTFAMLIDSTRTLGVDCLVADFCHHWSLSNNIKAKLLENGYLHARMFRFIQISKLKEMKFLLGEIACLKDTVEQWSSATE